MEPIAFPCPHPRASLARAFARALDEGLMALPLPDGRWLCKGYVLNATGPQPWQVECECADAVYRERICKHAAPVVFCRLYGLLPCPEATGAVRALLPGCLDDFLERLAPEQRAAA